MRHPLFDGIAPSVGLSLVYDDRIASKAVERCFTGDGLPIGNEIFSDLGSLTIIL